MYGLKMIMSTFYSRPSGLGTGSMIDWRREMKSLFLGVLLLDDTEQVSSSGTRTHISRLPCDVNPSSILRKGMGHQGIKPHPSWVFELGTSP